MTYRYPHARILIFSKAPTPGKAKTRLIPALGEQAAADFSARLTRHAVKTAMSSQLCPVQLWCAPDCQHTLFKELHIQQGIELKQQQGEDLGKRMAHALKESLVKHQAAILIGSDCPAITVDYLEQALQTLNNKSTCVLGPAEDGGYVLVGQSSFQHSMFENIDWGSASVLQQTRQQLISAKCEWTELATLWDVDRPEDIDRANKLMD